MRRTQREILLKLIIFCEKCNYTVLNYNIGGGVPSISDTASVIDEDGGVYDIEYLIGHGDWREVPNSQPIDDNRLLLKNCLER